MLLAQVVSVLSFLLRCESIIKGKPAIQKEFPFVASVTFKKEPICAGIILSMSFVLSPCQCYAMFNHNGSLYDTRTMYQIRVYAGTVYANLQPIEAQQYREPDLCLLHPKCRKYPWIVQFDYSLLRMQTPFYPSGTIQPIVLRLSQEELLRRLILKINSNGLCTVVGWGRQNVTFNGVYENPSKVHNMDILWIYYIHENIAEQPLTNNIDNLIFMSFIIIITYPTRNCKYHGPWSTAVADCGPKSSIIWCRPRQLLSMAVSPSFQGPNGNNCSADRLEGLPLQNVRQALATL